MRHLVNPIALAWLPVAIRIISLVRYVRKMPKIKSSCQIDFIVFLTLLGVK